MTAAHVPAAPQLDPDNPWPGLESYAESSREFFSGRVSEADELERRILDEPVTVLFGKSGLGKTSLLRAGVFPRLRAKGMLPIFIRVHVREDAVPLINQVRLTLLDELRASGIEHSEAAFRTQTLWQYLHTAGLEFWTPQNRLVRPVFVFDQFEELFTLGRSIPAHVAAFREDLADLAENRIPGDLASRLEQEPDLGRTLDTHAMPYKLVVSLREDFLADLEEWRLPMPSLRRNRMRLLPMGKDQAL
jgi:Novel STAND NTPase 1